jgi:hypothetical protein
MPVVMALLVVDAILVLHAAKTGRFGPWAYMIVALPGAGALAYVVLQLVPECLSTYRLDKARCNIARALEPERRYRALRQRLAVADTIADRATLAEACCGLGLFEEARGHYRDILTRPHGLEPAFMLGQAQAEFGLGCHMETLATLDALKARWPHYESRDGHLLYARALEECGRDQAAIAEYDALALYDSAAEPRVRQALLLRKIGRREEAQARLSYLLAEFGHAPRFVRRAHAEWLGVAAAAARR